MAVLVVGVLALLGARPAAAQSTSSLSWSRLPGAEACIGAGELARRVEQRLGRSALVAPSQADRSVEGRVAGRSGGRWRATVALARRDGVILSERSIETAEVDCRALDEALVLVIALLIDPDGSPAAAPEPMPRVIIREVVREVRVVEPWGMAARTGVDVAHGVLPGVAFSGLVALAVDAPRLPVAEIAGFGSLASDGETDLEGRAATMRVVGASLAVCPAVRRWLRVCGGARLSWFRWRGNGFEADASGSRVVPAAGAEARIELPVTSRVAATLSGGAWLPLRRMSVVYELSPAVSGDPDGTSETLYQSGVVSVWVGAGLVVRFL